LFAQRRLSKGTLCIFLRITPAKNSSRSFYAFDPDARGRMPVELKNAAQRCGYIVAGSNNSQNGQWKAELEAAQAMSQDTHAHLAIDNKRVYFAGLSGGGQRRRLARAK
jgi:hypothetical protein